MMDAEREGRDGPSRARHEAFLKKQERQLGLCPKCRKKIGEGGRCERCDNRATFDPVSRRKMMRRVSNLTITRLVDGWPLQRRVPGRKLAERLAASLLGRPRSNFEHTYAQMERAGIPEPVLRRVRRIHEAVRSGGLQFAEMTEDGRGARLGRLREAVEEREREAAYLRESLRMTREVASAAKTPITVDDMHSYLPENRGMRDLGRGPTPPGRNQPERDHVVSRGHTGLGRKSTDTMSDHRAGSQDDFSSTGMSEDEDGDLGDSRRYRLRGTEDEDGEMHIWRSTTIQKGRLRPSTT